jgi:hypothetical protein
MYSLHQHIFTSNVLELNGTENSSAMLCIICTFSSLVNADSS